jgi:hypothetical protein
MRSAAESRLDSDELNMTSVEDKYLAGASLHPQKDLH